MTFGLEPVWAWPFVVLSCLAMLAVTAVGYPRRIQQLPRLWQRTLISLRILLVLMITIWLCRPVVILESDDRSSASLYVILDSSRSMQTPDGPGGVSRRAAMLGLFESAKGMLDDLGTTVDVRFRDLADELTPFDQPAEVADGPSTAIGANLETLAKDADRERIAAVLFWGDGKQAASGRQNIAPINAARLLGRQHRPIYTVCYGTSDIASTSKDVAVSELDVSRDVFIRNVVPIKVRLRAFGAANEDVKLRVLVEKRAGLANGKSGPMEVVRPDQDNQTLLVHTITETAQDTVVELQFVPEQAGEIKIAVEAEPLNDEVRLTNNRVEAIIRVRSGGIRVAYFDDLRSEFKWLRRINVSSRVQLDAMWVRRGESVGRNEFDDNWFEPGNYDAFIIGNVPAALFGPQRLRKLYTCCEQGAGLMMIGGQNAFGLGGYHKTPLASLLPVAMSDGDQHLTSDIAMIPTLASVNNPMLQIAPPEQNAARWSSLPPLTGANVLRLKPGSVAQVLAESKTRVPMLVGQSTGAARVLAFAGDTTWQWAMMREDWGFEAHQRFWRQAIFWLTKMENDGETPLWVNVEPRDMNPGGLAELSFGLRDGDGVPLADVNYEANVQNPDGSRKSVAPRAIDTFAAADYQDTAAPGDYWVHVAAAGSGGEMNYASTRFLVNARDPELDNPVADPAMMRELAHLSGGDYLTPDQMLERLQLWVDEGLPSLAMKRSQRLSLWDNWISLLLFVSVITAEWVLRKKRGLV